MSLGKSKENSKHNPKKRCLDKTVSGKTEEHLSIDFMIHASLIQNLLGGGVGGDNLYHDWLLYTKCTLKMVRKINKSITNK